MIYGVGLHLIKLLVLCQYSVIPKLVNITKVVYIHSIFAVVF